MALYTRTTSHAQLAAPLGSLWHTIYMKHSKCHIRQSQNIKYSKRIVHRRKHPVMVVNAENIRNLIVGNWNHFTVFVHCNVPLLFLSMDWWILIIGYDVDDSDINYALYILYTPKGDNCVLLFVFVVFGVTGDHLSFGVIALVLVW